MFGHFSSKTLFFTIKKKGPRRAQDPQDRPRSVQERPRQPLKSYENFVKKSKNRCSIFAAIYITLATFSKSRQKIEERARPLKQCENLGF